MFECIIGFGKGLYRQISHYQRLGKTQSEGPPQASFGQGQQVTRYPELQAILVVRSGAKALESQQ